MADRHAKGISFPKGGRRGESCGMAPSAAFWGCPFASNWKWLRDPWMKVTAKRQSVISTSPLILHCKSQKAVNSKKVSALWCFVPSRHFSRPKRFGLEPGRGLRPRGRCLRVPLRSPHAHFAEGHESGSAQSPAEQNHAGPAVPSGDGHEPSEQTVEPEACFGLLEVRLADVYEFCIF